MTKREKVARMLFDAGFNPYGNRFSITKGPKVNSDIQECWHVTAQDLRRGKLVEIYSGYTMTELARKGLKLVPNTAKSELYGDFIAEPKP